MNPVTAFMYEKGTMTTQQETIFRKALQSHNPQAILNVAWALNDLGEPTKAEALLEYLATFHGILGPVHYGFGTDYAAVQTKLNALGANPPLVVDGIWGTKSKEALKAFQKEKGLQVDGIPGPISLGALGISGTTETVSSTMGHAVPANDSIDAQAYAVGKRAGTKMGLTDKEIEYVISVARGEGYYGYGWSHPSADTIALSKQFGLTGYEGADSNNWGAVQGTGSAGSFPHVDKHKDGTPYVGTYKKYATPDEAFTSMANIILKGGLRGATGAKEIKDAIAQGNLRKAVYAQHDNGYFELNPESYLSAVVKNYNNIMNNIGWPKLLAENGITPAIATGGAGVILGLAGLALYLFRKELGLVS